MVYQLQYLDYKDLATGKTLVVTPGSAYTVAVSPGRNAAMPAYPNDGRWTSPTNFIALEAEPAAPAGRKPQPLALKAADDNTKTEEGA